MRSKLQLSSAAACRGEWAGPWAHGCRSHNSAGGLLGSACAVPLCSAFEAWARTGHCLWLCPSCRLESMGVVPNKKSLVQTEKLSASSFCRRRLAVVMMRIKMAETLKEACTFIEQVSRIHDVRAYLPSDCQPPSAFRAGVGAVGTGWGLLQHRCFRGWWDRRAVQGSLCTYSLAMPHGQQRWIIRAETVIRQRGMAVALWEMGSAGNACTCWVSSG